MKLLPPREAAVEQEKKQASDIAQIALLTETIERLRKEANREEDAFQQRLAAQRKAYGEEKDKYREEIRELDTAAKHRREQLGILMRPIDAIREEARLRLEAVSVREAAVEKRESEMEEVIRSVAQRTDELSERAVILSAGEQDLIRRKAGIDAEAAMVSAGHKKLNTEIKDFREKQSKRAAELSAFEVTLEAKKKVHDTLMSEERSRIADDDRRVTAEWVRIKDERKVVQRIWNELENKKLKKI